MNRTRLDEIIAAYGADQRRWPEAEREAALALATHEGVDLTAARALDALLDAVPSPNAPSDLLQARILAQLPKPQSRVSVARWGWALVACMVFGVVAGYGLGAAAPAGQDVDGLIVAAFASDSEVISSGFLGDAL